MVRAIRVTANHGWEYHTAEGWIYLCPADSLPGLYDDEDILCAQRLAAKKYGKQQHARVDAGTVAVEY